MEKDNVILYLAWTSEFNDSYATLGWCLKTKNKSITEGQISLKNTRGYPELACKLITDFLTKIEEVHGEISEINYIEIVSLYDFSIVELNGIILTILHLLYGQSGVRVMGCEKEQLTSFAKHLPKNKFKKIFYDVDEGVDLDMVENELLAVLLMYYVDHTKSLQKF